MKKSFLLFLVIFLRSFFLFASDKSRILSPSEGVWANKQCLFVDLKDGEECYYSLSGADAAAMEGFYLCSYEDDRSESEVAGVSYA